MKARGILAAIAAIACGALAADADAAEARLRAASFQPERVVFAKHFYRWVRETNKRCAGKVAIAVVGPAVIEPRLQWHALKTGGVDMYYGPASYYRGVLPEGDVFNLARNEAADQRRNGAWALINALHNDKMNAWYLTTLNGGIKFFVYTTRPAAGARFDGLRLRSVPLYENFLRSLGARTRYLAAPALNAALAGGSVDGYGWPLWGLDIFGWDKHTKFRYGPGFLNAASPVLVNLDRWKSLSDGQRRCLSEMAGWVESVWPEWRAAENAAQLAALKKAGVEYVDLGAGFARRAEDLHWAQIELARPEFVKKVKALVQPAR